MNDSEERYQIPVDVEREDRILAGLTWRQLALLAGTAVVLWLLFLVTRDVVPLPVFAGAAFPVGAVAIAVALGRRDGLPMDRWLRHGLLQARSPRRLVAAPEGVPPAPAWMRDPPMLPAPLRMPVHAVSDSGVVDLGAEGVAVICEASTVNLALRTPREQSALVGVFAGWLSGLSGPVQILVQADEVDVTPLIAGLIDRAPALPHPALEQAATEHAGFLAELAERRDLLRRRVFVVLREQGPVVRTRASGPGGTGHGDAGWRALRRAEETVRALSAAGITARVLDGRQAAGVIAGCCAPWRPSSPDGERAAPDEPVTSVWGP